MKDDGRKVDHDVAQSDGGAGLDATHNLTSFDKRHPARQLPHTPYPLGTSLWGPKRYKSMLVGGTKIKCRVHARLPCPATLLIVLRARDLNDTGQQ